MSSPFYQVLDEMRSLHDRKNADYGQPTDPFANVRASQDFGIAPWLGAVIRLNDKVQRIKSFTANGNLVNESLRDSLIDIAVYGAIAVALYDEDFSVAEQSLRQAYRELEENEAQIMNHLRDIITEHNEAVSVDGYEGFDEGPTTHYTYRPVSCWGCEQPVQNCACGPRY